MKFGTQNNGVFDNLPDDLVLDILNKVMDAKSVVRCLTVSKRFNVLVPRVEAISLPLPRRRDHSSRPAKIFRSMVRFLQGLGRSERRRRGEVQYHSPVEALRVFRGLKTLALELPPCKGELGLAGRGSLLKWKAEFGKGLRSCVVLGATSVLERDGEEREPDGVSPPSPLGDEDLKTRIVWMISSLIAASARHHLTRRVASAFPGLESVVVSDGDRRGRVAMGGDELRELRSESGSESESESERSMVPDLGMKLWHVPRMVLPRCGLVLEGATLVVITPLHCGGSDGGDPHLLSGAGFDADPHQVEIFGEAIQEIIKLKKCYSMEMTSF